MVKCEWITHSHTHLPTHSPTHHRPTTHKDVDVDAVFVVVSAMITVSVGVDVVSTISIPPTHSSNAFIVITVQGRGVHHCWQFLRDIHRLCRISFCQVVRCIYYHVWNLLSRRIRGEFVNSCRRLLTNSCSYSNLIVFWPVVTQIFKK